MWAWPTGIANSSFWLILFWDTRLFLDAGLQLVYIGLGVAGWVWWVRGGRADRLAAAVARIGSLLTVPIGVR